MAAQIQVIFCIDMRAILYRFLRSTERYTKADMVYLTRGGFWISLSQTASSLLSLLLIIAFANLLPKETYGTYRYILSIAGVLNVLTLTSMNSAVSRSVAGGNEGALRAAVRYQLKWNLLMFAGFFALGGYYLIQGDTLFAWSFFILGLFVPATQAFNTYGAYLDGRREFRLASISNIVSVCIYTAGVFATIYFSGEVVWLIAAYALTTFATALYFYRATVRHFKPPLTRSDETISYGRQLTLIRFIDPIASQVDKIILAHFWGPTELAIYSLAMAMPSRAMSYIKNWVGLGFPKFVTKTRAELDTMFYRRIIQGISVGTLFALAYIILAPYLFYYLLPKYLESVFYSQILSLSLIFAMPNRYVSLLLVAQKLPRRILVNNVTQTTLKITLYVILGFWGGILGLVIANVLNALISMLINISVWKIRTSAPQAPTNVAPAIS